MGGCAACLGAGWVLGCGGLASAGFWGEAGGDAAGGGAEVMRLEAELKMEEPKPNIFPETDSGGGAEGGGRRQFGLGAEAEAEQARLRLGRRSLRRGRGFGRDGAAFSHLLLRSARILCGVARSRVHFRRPS